MCSVYSVLYECTELNVTICCVSGLLDADMETAPPADQAMEKVKKRYRKKKTKLEEAFPSYLQVTHAHKVWTMSTSLFRLRTGSVIISQNQTLYKYLHEFTCTVVRQLIQKISLDSFRRRSLVGIFWTRAGR